MSLDLASPSTPKIGAYGLAFAPSIFPAQRLNLLPADTPSWTVALQPTSSPLVREPDFQGIESAALRGASNVEDHTATVELIGFDVSIDRESSSATIAFHGSAAPERLVHPCLAPIGIVVAHWAARVPLHAGAVILDGKAWGLLANRSYGKSTTTAALAAAGFPILTDDLLVIDDQLRAHAGPRCVDLRRSSAATFPDAVELTDEISLTQGRGRFRLTTEPVPATVPLAGFIRLEWSSQDVSLEPLKMAERLWTIGAANSLYNRMANPRLTLDLAALPMFTLSRPKDLASLPATIDAIASLADRA